MMSSGRYKGDLLRSRDSLKGERRGETLNNKRLSRNVKGLFGKTA